MAPRHVWNPNSQLASASKKKVLASLRSSTHRLGLGFFFWVSTFGISLSRPFLSGTSEPPSAFLIRPMVYGHKSEQNVSGVKVEASGKDVETGLRRAAHRGAAAVVL